MSFLYYSIDVSLRFLFLFTLLYYLATNLQWYNYSFYRIVTKHHKLYWHVYYFLVPAFCFILFYPFYQGLIFYLYFFFIALPLFALWYKEIDKKLIWTKRIVRLFVLVFACAILQEILTIRAQYYYGFFSHISLFLPLIIGILCSMTYEEIAFKSYAILARKKLFNMPNLTVIAITGSYGKTSIKNFIYELVKDSFNVYATPRSVNTYKGLVADINTHLTKDTQIYIAEAGARNKGDIAKISSLLSQHYGIISKIGHAHIEYFKNIETTIKTKFEILYSPRLKKVFVQKNNLIPQLNTKQDSTASQYSGAYKKNSSQSLPASTQTLYFEQTKFASNLQKITLYPLELRNIESTLDGISFEMQIDSHWYSFKTAILGRFNVDNIAVAILIARELGIEITEIQKSVRNLQPVPHRLFKITTPQKIILDDSFNGNFDGMSEAIALSSLHKGRKVIVTPGLIEYDAQSNIALCKQIDSVFDIVIITGSLNAQLLNSHIHKAHKILLKDKSTLESVLSQTGQNGDLVLFANDAPNYI